MDTDLICSREIEQAVAEAFLALEQGDAAGSEQLVLKLMQEAKSDQDRYFSCLYYGEFLLRAERWEEAREVLTQGARIALHSKKEVWLVLSHEKLGDLSAAEGNWFGARHQYRYALRKAAPLTDRSLIQQLEMRAKTAQNTLESTTLVRDEAILPLSREYISGTLAISFVHRDVFLKKYFARCLECGFCHDACCSYGADIDVQNVQKIQQRKEQIQPFIRPSVGEWFELEYTYYEEYAGNEYTRIHPYGPRCAFLSRDQRGCGLHRYAISNQMDYHEIKPLICILFPLSFGEGILMLAPELEDNSLICAGAGDSAYRSLRNELAYYFGGQFVEELDALENRVVSAFNGLKLL